MPVWNDSRTEAHPVKPGWRPLRTEECDKYLLRPRNEEFAGLSPSI
jgi:hypothetical protein